MNADDYSYQEEQKKFEELDFNLSMSGRCWEEPEPCNCQKEAKEIITRKSPKAKKDLFLWDKFRVELLKLNLVLAGIHYCSHCKDLLVGFVKAEALRPNFMQPIKFLPKHHQKH